MKASAILRAGLAAGTLGTLVAGSALFANIAAADTTGYQTGYTYHQGLATNAGANLVAQDGSSANTTGTSNSTSNQGTTVSQSTTETSGTSATTPTSAAVDTTGSAAVTPAADTNTAQAAAVQPAVTADTNAAATAATPTTVLASQPFMFALWVILGLAVLALIAMGISAIVNAMNPNTDEDSYADRRVSYQ